MLVVRGTNRRRFTVVKKYAPILVYSPGARTHSTLCCKYSAHTDRSWRLYAYEPCTTTCLPLCLRSSVNAPQTVTLRR